MLKFITLLNSDKSLARDTTRFFYINIDLYINYLVENFILCLLLNLVLVI